MLVVPVIDLKDGQVVHARRGDRAKYAPIRTPLAASADPAAVVAGLLSVAPFANLYVADLDAIEGGSAQVSAVDALAERFPSLRLWVDRGAGTEAAVVAQLARGNQDVVIGSESQADTTLLVKHREDPNVILSLDFRDNAFLGPVALLEEPEFWPERVIVMTLARVGSGAGPDVDRLAGIKARAGHRRVFAAGGVRHMADLEALADAGISGALVATSIHEGAIRVAMLPPHA
ncbi:MAG: HisA/HisF-related TIM barrel protein [Hyphomicrobiales bacterium]